MIFDPPPLPPDIPNIEVRAPDTGAPMLWLGFFAFGDPASVDRLAAAAQALGFRGGPVETSGDEKEYGVIFGNLTTREQAADFARRASTGEFGRLRIGNVMVPPSAVRRPAQ
ncbi:MAG: SPOR domain-containing protein [Sphingomonadaceae bacterium]|nr:SPOR domain-containing protein [Sphingomonadaceae bacterium]